MPRLFVSHAAKDEELVEDFVDLLQVGVGIHPDDVFCSSLPGMNIPTGKAFIDHIKSQVTNPELVVLLVSPEFLQSQFCHNEVGASWGLSLPVYPLLVPPVDYGDLGGVLAGTQMAKLDSREALSDLRDDLIEKLKLTPLRTSHWERKRDRFLRKLEAFLGENPSAAGTVAAAESAVMPAVVTSSGSWMKLGDGFYVAQRFEHDGRDSITVQLYPSNLEEEAALKRLRPSAFGKASQIGFAYENEGGLCTVESVNSLSEGGKTHWSVQLAVQEDREWWKESSLNEHSADDIAEMRAGRLLINDPPPPRRKSQGYDFNFLESFIVGRSGSPAQTGECVVRRIVGEHRERPEALSWARLEAVFRLMASGIVEHVLEFSLGPLQGDKLHVRFRGQRPSRNQSEVPAVIEIEGDCVLL